MNYAFCKILLSVLFCFVCISCSEHQSNTQDVIVARVMPLSVWDDASAETFYWERQKFLFPQIEIPNPLPKGVPNDDSFLNVSIEKDGKIKLNAETIADLQTIEYLQTRLENIFLEREENKVFEPNSEKVVKVTAIKANRYLKYDDVMKVIKAIKKSGAEPIILQIDDLPE